MPNMRRWESFRHAWCMLHGAVAVLISGALLRACMMFSTPDGVSRGTQAHLKFEDNFWFTKMGLNGASNEALAKTKTDYESGRCALQSLY